MNNNQFQKTVQVKSYEEIKLKFSIDNQDDDDNNDDKLMVSIQI